MRAGRYDPSWDCRSAFTDSRIKQEGAAPTGRGLGSGADAILGVRNPRQPGVTAYHKRGAVGVSRTPHHDHVALFCHLYAGAPVALAAASPHQSISKPWLQRASKS